MGPCMLNKYEHISYPLISMVNYSDTMKTFLFSIDQAVNKVSAVLGCCLLNSNSLDHNHLNTEYSMFNGARDLRRIPAKVVAKLGALYKGACTRVKTLKASIIEITKIINERSFVRKHNGVNQRVHLSLPDVEKLRDKRNRMEKDLVVAREDQKKHRDNYLKAVRNNKAVSKADVKATRDAVKTSKEDAVLKKVKSLLSDAYKNSGKNGLVSLQQLAESKTTNSEFSQFVKNQTGISIPKGADLSRLRGAFVTWSPETLKEDATL